MDATSIQVWMQTIAPYLGIAVTVWVAMRVQTVHRLVNSEMDQFRKALKDLADSQKAGVFHAGQQDVRDTTRGLITAAAVATTAAALATEKAADATVAANPPSVSVP
jgi:hypothetical protein